MTNKYNAYKTYFLAFLLPIIMLLLAYIIIGVYPFGALSVLSSDLSGQYMNLTVNVAQRLKAGDNIFLTWRSGLGSNMYAWATYILMSPLNILFLLFDVKYYQEVYLVVILLKFGFIGLFTSMYLKKSKLCGVDGILNLIFVLFYTMCAFNIKATINVMWLDNAALLPLVLLGIEKVINEKKWTLFTACVAFCFITNYYISYITGVFCLMYFCYYCFVCKISFKQSLKSFGILFITTLLALGIAAVVVLPAWEAISSTYTNMFGTEESSKLICWGAKDILKSFFFVINDYATNKVIHGFFGILPIVLVIAYFFNKKIETREKLAAAVILFIFIISFVFIPLYVAWHLFRMPTCFEGRFFFAIAMFFVIIAIRSIKNLHSVEKKLLIFPALLCIVGVNYAMLGEAESWQFMNTLLVMAIAIAYCVLLGKIIDNNDNIKAKKIIIVLAVCEILIATIAGIIVMRNNDGYAIRDNHMKFTGEYKDIIEEIQEEDSSFYRMDSTIICGYNSPMTVGYNGINHFSSLANQKTFDVLKKLGVLLETDNKVLFTYDQSITLDSLLNIKYVAAINKNNKLEDTAGREIYIDSGFRLTSDVYEEVMENATGKIFENKLCFPLMFAVEDGIMNIDEQLYDKEIVLNGGYKSQELFFNSLYNTNLPLYSSSEFETREDRNVAIVEEGEFGKNKMSLIALEDGKTVATLPEEIGSTIYKYTVKEAGNYYTSINAEIEGDKKINEYCKVGINGIPAPTVSFKGECINLGYYEQGDELSLQISASTDIAYYKPILLKLNQTNFESISKQVNENKLFDITQNGNDIVAYSRFDADKLIFSSIAYDEGFHIYIDGAEADKICIASGFLGYEVPRGEHKIEIKYVSLGYEVGKNITLISCGILVMILVCLKLKKKIKKLEIFDL